MMDYNYDNETIYASNPLARFSHRRRVKIHCKKRSYIVAKARYWTMDVDQELLYRVLIRPSRVGNEYEPFMPDRYASDRSV